MTLKRRQSLRKNLRLTRTLQPCKDIMLGYVRFHPFKKSHSSGFLRMIWIHQVQHAFHSFIHSYRWDYASSSFELLEVLWAISTFSIWKTSQKRHFQRITLLWKLHFSPGFGNSCVLEQPVILPTGEKLCLFQHGMMEQLLLEDGGTGQNDDEWEKENIFFHPKCNRTWCV